MSFRTVGLFLSIYTLSNLVYRETSKYNQGMNMCYASAGSMSPLFVDFEKSSKDGRGDEIHLNIPGHTEGELILNED